VLHGSRNWSDGLRRHLFILVGVICLLVICDQLAKALVRLLLRPNETVILVPNVAFLCFKINETGFSWWLPSLPDWAGLAFRLLLFMICLLAIPVYLFYSLYRRSGKWVDLAFVGIAASLCGHLSDDLFMPFTTDFIRLGHGPSANLADVYSYFGLTALVIEMVLYRRKYADRGGGIRHRLSMMGRTRKQFIHFLAGDLWRFLFAPKRSE
jgi:lipoprotein signal peptidase